ncbi:MAG: acetate uptake transporter [Thermoplasmatales archaeon]|nr:acetate uptake transporter [Thermoplasmatales archaeon]
MTERKYANPGALGLCGFALTTFLLTGCNALGFDSGSMILGMGIFFGGLLQVWAGAMEFRNGDAFGGLAFSSYGAYWLSFCAMRMFPVMGWGAPADNNAVGLYLFIWGVFSAMMFVGTLKKARVLQLVFGLLVVLFMLLAAENFLIAAGNGAWEAVGKAAAWVGVVLGLVALYAGVGGMLNEVEGRELFPMGKVG